MKNCEIIQDLLPLYKDKVVSASSTEMIEEHLKSCEDCKNELEKMQCEIKVSINPAKKTEIGAFALIKKKLLRRKVIIACISAISAVALALGTIHVLYSIQTVIPYTDGFVADIRVDSGRQTIDLVTTIEPGGFTMSGIAVTESGETVRLYFITFSETLLSKWQNNHSEAIEYVFRVVEPSTPPQPDPEDKPGALLIYEPFDRCEIYYVNDQEINPEMDYPRLRTEAVLLWSGAFE